MDNITNEKDETNSLLMDVIQYAIKEKQISMSIIQRKFKIGYARAGKIIDQMETKWIISGYEGSEPQKVLIANDNINNVKNDEKKVNIQEINYTETMI